MLKIRQLHLIKENWAWNAKKPWCNYYWADNETPQHSYPAFCQDGHATTVCAKDLDVHVTCEACAASKKDFPGIMTGLSGMVKDVQFDDDAASQLVLILKGHSVFFLFTDEELLNMLDRLIKGHDEKQSITNKEKRALLRKMLVLLEDANSLEREPTYNPIKHGWPISQAILDEILDIAAPEEATK